MTAAATAMLFVVIVAFSIIPDAIKAGSPIPKAPSTK